MQKIERLVQQEQQAGDPRRSQQVIGSPDRLRDEIEGKHDDRPKNGRPHPDHFPVQVNDCQSRGSPDRKGDPEKAQQGQYSRPDQSDVQTADAEYMDNARSLIEFLCIIIQKTFFPQEHSLHDRCIFHGKNAICPGGENSF